MKSALSLARDVIAFIVRHQVDSEHAATVRVSSLPGKSEQRSSARFIDLRHRRTPPSLSKTVKEYRSVTNLITQSA